MGQWVDGLNTHLDKVVSGAVGGWAHHTPGQGGEWGGIWQLVAALSLDFMSLWLYGVCRRAMFSPSWQGALSWTMPFGLLVCLPALFCTHHGMP